MLSIDKIGFQNISKMRFCLCLKFFSHFVVRWVQVIALWIWSHECNINSKNNMEICCSPWANNIKGYSCLGNFFNKLCIQKIYHVLTILWMCLILIIKKLSRNRNVIYFDSVFSSVCKVIKLLRSIDYRARPPQIRHSCFSMCISADPSWACFITKMIRT